MSDSDSRKSEIIKELKNAEFKDLENMVFRRELLYSEIQFILYLKHIDASSTKYTLPPGI